MKKIYVILGVALLSAACAKAPAADAPGAEEPAVETPATEEVKNVVFSASFAEEPAVKTVLVGDGTVKNVNWVKDEDVISILWDGGSATAAAETSGATSSFSAGVGAASLYYGVYPSSVASSYSAGTLSVTIPSAQHGTFAEANIAVASTTSSNLNFGFKNLCALAKVTITRSDIAEIRFSGAGNEVLAGAVTVSLDGSGIPSCDASSALDKEIVLTPATGTAFAAGTYYFSMVPQDLSSGLSIQLTTESGKTIMTRATAKKASLERSVILNFGTLDTIGTPTELKLTFDFTGTAPAGWPTNTANFTYDPKGAGYRDVQRRHNCTYTLDGTDYSFMLANCDGADANEVYWTARAAGKTNCIHLKSQYRYFGFPAISGYKLTKVVAKCERYSSGTVPKIGIVSDILGYAINPYTNDSYSSYIIESLQEWGATGSIQTYTLDETVAGTMYYFFCSVAGGFNQLELTYTK